MSDVSDALSDFHVVDHKVDEIIETFGGGTHRPPSHEEWHVIKFGADSARKQYGVDGTGVRVAVLDTGVHASHPYLEGKVSAHDCTGDGAKDEDGHGSHCCGITHAVAPGAEIISIRVFDRKNIGVHRNIMKALREILDGKYGKIDVINMSLGGGAPSQDMRMALLDLNARGVLVVCAAGNEADHARDDAPRFGTVNWPAHFNSTVAVGSVNMYRIRSQYSSSGPKITVMAPGERVISSWKDDSMAILSGTSMASPYVAGCFALLVHHCSENKLPPPTLSRLLWALASSSTDLEVPGFDFFTGYGCINPGGLIHRYTELCSRIESSVYHL